MSVQNNGQIGCDGELDVCVCVGGWVDEYVYCHDFTGKGHVCGNRDGAEKRLAHLSKHVKPVDLQSGGRHAGTPELDTRTGCTIRNSLTTL